MNLHIGDTVILADVRPLSMHPQRCLRCKTTRLHAVAAAEDYIEVTYCKFCLTIVNIIQFRRPE